MPAPATATPTAAMPPAMPEVMAQPTAVATETAAAPAVIEAAAPAVEAAKPVETAPAVDAPQTIMFTSKGVFAQYANGDLAPVPSGTYKIVGADGTTQTREVKSEIKSSGVAPNDPTNAVKDGKFVNPAAVLAGATIEAFAKADAVLFTPPAKSWVQSMAEKTANTQYAYRA